MEDLIIIVTIFKLGSDVTALLLLNLNGKKSLRNAFVIIKSRRGGCLLGRGGELCLGLQLATRQNSKLECFFTKLLCQYITLSKTTCYILTTLSYYLISDDPIH